MASLTISTTHGKEQPEKATLAFIIANNAAASDQETAVFLMAESVWFATPGGADGVQHEGMEPLAKSLASYVEHGGALWVCGACAKPRGITSEHLVPGAKIMTAANLVERLASGSASLSF